MIIIHRILAIIWFAFCGYTGLGQLWPVFHPYLYPHRYLVIGILGNLLIVILYWSGSVASFYLFRGARWAARYVASITVINAILIIGVESLFGISEQRNILIIFSLVSALLLFLPRHEPVP
jgi:hypothetical protein